MLTLTRQLLHLRRTTPALSIGSYRAWDSVPDDCFAYIRSDGAQQCMIMLNFGPEERQVELPVDWSGAIRVSTHVERRDETVCGTLPRRGSEGLIVSGAGDTNPRRVDAA
ncbi:MAG: DUF3459 domain-containing protein [Chloroflexota bacterium]|nr:DUF3459 domain-containing protein [Chloroflexota bacterium]